MGRWRPQPVAKPAAAKPAMRAKLMADFARQGPIKQKITEPPMAGASLAPKAGTGAPVAGPDYNQMVAAKAGGGQPVPGAVEPKMLPQAQQVPPGAEPAVAPPPSGPIAAQDQLPPNAGGVVPPAAQPALPPRLQKAVASGRMTAEGAANRYEMFQNKQLPGQQLPQPIPAQDPIPPAGFRVDPNGQVRSGAKPVQGMRALKPMFQPLQTPLAGGLGSKPYLGPAGGGMAKPYDPTQVGPQAPNVRPGAKPVQPPGAPVSTAGPAVPGQMQTTVMPQQMDTGVDAAVDPAADPEAARGMRPRQVVEARLRGKRR
jgi:hypothetical protein